MNGTYTHKHQWSCPYCFVSVWSRRNYEDMLPLIAEHKKTHMTPPKRSPAKQGQGLPEAIICDLDGTLALFGDANPYDRDFLQDKINPSVADVLDTYQAACGDGWGEVQLIIVSGRKDKYKAQTKEWLKKNLVYYDALYMRKTAPDGQPEPKDVLVKQEIYETYIKGKYNALFVLDDRDQVVDMWRSLGLTCFQVAPGNF